LWSFRARECLRQRAEIPPSPRGLGRRASTDSGRYSPRKSWHRHRMARHGLSSRRHFKAGGGARYMGGPTGMIAAASTGAPCQAVLTSRISIPTSLSYRLQFTTDSKIKTNRNNPLLSAAQSILICSAASGSDASSKRIQVINETTEESPRQ